MADIRREKPRQVKEIVIAIAEEIVVEESVADECIIDESSTMDAVEEGPSKQTIFEPKVEEISLPDVAEEFIAPTGHRFMDMSILDSVLSMVSFPRCFRTSLN